MLKQTIGHAPIGTGTTVTELNIGHTMAWREGVEMIAVDQEKMSQLRFEVLRSMIEVTAGAPETAVSIVVDGLTKAARGTTQSTLVEAAVATVVVTAVVTAEIVVRIVTTTVALTVKFLLAEMIGTTNVEAAESSMTRRIADMLGKGLLVDTMSEATGSTAAREMATEAIHHRAGERVAILGMAGDNLRLQDLARLGRKYLESLLAGTLCELKVCLTT